MEENYMIGQEKYAYKDIAIVPAVISDIEHRAECEVDIKNLPLITAPMDSVVNQANFEQWKRYGITPILPRTLENPLDYRLGLKDEWVAFSLKEFEEHWEECGEKVLIDMANGHVARSYKVVKEATTKRPELQVMVGNIANPETYMMAYNSNAWGVRLGIGAGFGCITSSQLGVNYPLASLVDETYEIKKSLAGRGPKIIADGGVRGFSDVIKALALGADYVMIGSVFTSMLESAGKTYITFDTDLKFEEVSDSVSKDIVYKDGKFFINGEEVRVEKLYYGMASSLGQVAMNGKKTKTAEGTIKRVPVKYTMEGWTENFVDYLRSAMSYTGSHNLDEFKESRKIVLSQAAQESINK